MASWRGQVLTCFAGTKVLAYGYKSTNTDTEDSQRHGRQRCSSHDALGSRCSLALLVQKYVLTRTNVRILTPPKSPPALALKAKNILELGVRGGATTMPLLMAAKEVRLLAIHLAGTKISNSLLVLKYLT